MQQVFFYTGRQIDKMAFMIFLYLPAHTLSGLIGEADSPPLFFMFYP